VLGNCYVPQALAFMKFISDLRKQYGQLFTFFALGNGFLVVADPVVVRRILSDTKTFVKGFVYTDYFHLAFGDGLVTSSGERHKTDRGIFGKYFTRSNIVKYVPRINGLVREAMDELKHELEHSNDINAEHFFAKLTFRTFMAFAFNCRLSPVQEYEIIEATSYGSFLVGRLVGLGLPTWNFIPHVRTLNFYTEESWYHYEPLIEARKAALARGEMTDVDDTLAAMLNHNMTKQEIAWWPPPRRERMEKCPKPVRSPKPVRECTHCCCCCCCFRCCCC
jgi:cytochrome P450